MKANSISKKACMTKRKKENPGDENLSSPMKRQLTVHLKRNCRVNWKALPRYDLQFVVRKGTASRNCICAIKKKELMALLGGNACNSTRPRAGAARSMLILMLAARENKRLPKANHPVWIQ